MNEIDLQQKQSDFELLSRLKPQWQQSQPEPFIRNPQNDVVIPTWNKINIPQSSFSSSAPPSTTESTYVTFNVIIGGQRFLADIDAINIRPV